MRSWTKKQSSHTRDSKTLLAELKACSSSGNLVRGKEIHAEVVKHGIVSCIYVATALMNMYARCGSMAEARQLFDKMRHPDVTSCNVLILGYAENGEAVSALNYFAKMKCQGYAPNSGTFVAALKACSSLALQRKREECLSLGKQIHLEIGGYLNIYVCNTLINMYAKLGSMVDARQVFNSMKQPNLVTWNAIILGYAENGEGVTALKLFTSMKLEGCAPDCRTFISALRACISLAIEQDESGRAECLEQGRQIHSEIGCHSDIYVQSTLVDMYAKSGKMLQAQQVFDSIKDPNVVSWTALILGYAENGEGAAALDLFAKMKSHGCAPDCVTFIAALKACTSLALNQTGNGKAECRERGKQIHMDIGFHLSTYVQTTLIDMYTKCESMVEARQVFDGMKHPDVASWNALILGYVEIGEAVNALDVFTMMKLQGFAPNPITFVAALKACTSIAQGQDGRGKAECLERGKQIHSQICFHMDSYVQSTLIDMYAKCGSMVEAHRVFDSMKKPDVTSWTALISGYAESRDGVTALDLFAKMRSEGSTPDSITYIAALKACALLGALDFGSKIHSEIEFRNEQNEILVTCLVDFYAKCGSLVEAQKVFDLHAGTSNVTTCNALLTGYSRVGDNKAVFALFERMQDAGFQPNAVTLLCILTCCSHGGLVEKGRECFEEMSIKYGITPTVEHYSCMIDILGRSNMLDNAIALLQSMPYKPNAVTWMTVLGACHKWENVKIGRLAFKSLVSLEETNAAAYVLMAHIYGSKCMWEEQETVLRMRK